MRATLKCLALLQQCTAESQGPLRRAAAQRTATLRPASPQPPRSLNGKYLRNAWFQPDRIYSNKIRFPNLPLPKNKSYMKEPERSEHVSDFAREKSKNKADIRILHAHTDHRNKLNGIISIFSKIQIFHQGALNHHEPIQIFLFNGVLRFLCYFRQVSE